MLPKEQILFEGYHAVLRNDWQTFASLFDLKLHDGQVRFLQNSNAFNDEGLPRENVLHPGNGWGKTEVLSLKHLAYHVVHSFRFISNDPNSDTVFKGIYKTLNIAITQEQSMLVFDRVVELVRRAPLMSWFLLGDPVRFPTARIRFAFGSEMEAKTTKKKAESVEGKEYGYISADEIALERYLEFIREKILLPRLRRKDWWGKQLDFSATPKGKNAYYRIVQTIRRARGHIQGGTSYDNPFSDHLLWDYLRKSWSAPKVQQTIMGEFIDTSEMMFASRVDVLFNNDLKFEGVDPAFNYIEAWDLARGRKGIQSDSTVGLRAKLIDNRAQIVHRWSVQLPWTEKERENINAEAGSDIESASIESTIRNAQFMSGASVKIDSTGVGDTLFGMVQDIAERCDFAGGQGSSKDKLLDHAQAIIDSGQIVSPFIPELADEMTTYERDDKNLSTDNIMAFVVLCQHLYINRVDYGTL